MVVHAAVEDEELLSARDLDVVDASDVDARFRDQIAARLDDELRAGEMSVVSASLQSSSKPREALRDRVPARAKVGNAEPAAKIQRVERTAEPRGDAARDVEAVRYWLTRIVASRIWVPVKIWIPQNRPAGSQDHIQHFVETLFVYAERRRLAAHAHGAALDFGRRIHAYGHARAFAQPAADGDDPRRLERRFDVNLADSARENELELRFCLPRPGEKHPLGRSRRREPDGILLPTRPRARASFRKYSGPRVGFAFTE